MSVALTEDAVRERRKTVTRRHGWLFAKAGDRLTLCRQVMGRRKGEPLVRLAEVEIVSVRREPLCVVTGIDVGREGFTGWTAPQFVQFFTDHMGGDPCQEVTRIEWRYLDRRKEQGEWRRIKRAAPEDAPLTWHPYEPSR
jgi:hypothetical protein